MLVKPMFYPIFIGFLAVNLVYQASAQIWVLFPRLAALDPSGPPRSHHGVNARRLFIIIQPKLYTC